MSKELKKVKTVDGKDEIYVPSNVWNGTPCHPQCAFFELLPADYGADSRKEYTIMMCHLFGNANVCKGDYCKCPLENELPALRARIAELEAPQEWVSVDERLPKADTDVIVRNRYGKIFGAFMMPSSNGVEWFESYDGNKLSNVTHWRPLPQPPEAT